MGERIRSRVQAGEIRFLRGAQNGIDNVLSIRPPVRSSEPPRTQLTKATPEAGPSMDGKKVIR